MWVAHWTYAYGENIKPIEMKGWAPYTFWQFSGERDFLDGITNELGAPVPVDFDVFKGTLEQLYALAGETAPSASKYTVKTGDTLKNIGECHTEKNCRRDAADENTRVPNLGPAGVFE